MPASAGDAGFTLPQSRPTSAPDAGGGGMPRIAAAPTPTMAGALSALGALGALSACGPSDSELREEVRQGVLGSCLEAAQGKSAPAGLDGRAFCSCVTDRLTEGRSGRELKERAPGDAERREAVALCRAET